MFADNRLYAVMIRAVDIAPTVAAAVGVELVDRDGRVRRDLLAADGAFEPDSGDVVPDPGTAARVDAAEVAALRLELLQLRAEVNGLKAAHHETRIMAERLDGAPCELQSFGSGAGTS